MNDLVVLLISSIRWPLTAKLALTFLRQGCKVEVVCPQDHPFSFVGGINKVYRYSGVNSFRSLDEAIRSAEPDLLVPCDDGVVWQLHELHRTRAEFRALIERSLGAAAGYEAVASRAKLMQIAQELHIRAPRTIEVHGLVDVQAWFSAPGKETSGVLKLDWTCGGKGVQIVHSLPEGAQALALMRRPLTLATALGRWLLIHDALAFWKWKNLRLPGITLQQFVQGRPANTMLACREGKVLAMLTVEVLCAQSSTGTALVVRRIENEEIRSAGERIAQRLELSGFHGLDFMIEDETEHAYLIELNPRVTQLGHLRTTNQGTTNQGDVVGAFCCAFGGPDLAQSNRAKAGVIHEETIAFFPEAIFANPKCPYLASSYVDVPWEEPRLVMELVRRDWRDRRLLARLYRALKPEKKSSAVFERQTAQVGELVGSSGQS